jgi:hypothetical protein
MIQAENPLEVLANVAAILTAIVAVWAYGRYLWVQRQRRLRLEHHLREERHVGNQGHRTLLHLVAHLGMSEAEIIDAAFKSKVIRRRVSVDDQGRANRLLLEYDSGNQEDDLPRRGKKGRCSDRPG